MKLSTSITLEHTYQQNTVVYDYLHTVKLHNSGIKYVAHNADSSKLVLYNSDYTVFKIINLNIPAGTGVNYSIFYISELLFDEDTTIEYMINGVINNQYYVKIFNEDGSLLWEESECSPGCVIDIEYKRDAASSRSVGAVVNSDLGTKMIIHANFNSADYTYANTKVKIYGLPGSMINAQNGLELYNGEIPAQFKIYPNPSGNSATIEYALPQGESNGEIVITNLMGSVVKKVAVGSGSGSLQLENTQLPAGTYFYQLTTSKGSIGTKKMVIVK